MTATLNSPTEVGSSLRWDWYQATVRSDEMGTYPERLAPLLAEDLGATIDSDRGLYGYAEQALLRREGSVVARVLYGGSNRWPNAWASGDAAPEFAEVMRSRFPGTHLVTRADVAHDVQGPDAFEQLQTECLTIADDRGLSVSQAGDWHRREKGRTLYVGSRSSTQFVRLYEKGLEQRAKAPTAEAAAAVPADWVRLELVVKPDKPARRLLAASAAPVDLFGHSLWTKTLAAAVFALDVPRVERLSWLRSEDDNTLDWMVRQYAAHLVRKAEQLGSAEALGRYLLVRAEEQIHGS